MAGGATAVHVHVGAGRLGLGLPVYATRKVGYDVVVANRPGEVADRLADELAYQVRLGPDRTETVAIDRFIALDDEGETELAGVVADPRCRLLTTAVTMAGLEELVPLLRRTLEARRATSGDDPLFVIACENQVGPDFDDLRHDFRDGTIHFLRCTVDRLCSDLAVSTVAPSVVVSTEQYANWVIEAPVRLEEIAQEHLVELRLGDIAELVPDIVPYMWRKRWLVNGVHLVVALLAWRARFPRLDRFVAQPAGRDALRGAQLEFTTAIAARTTLLSPAHLMQFNDEVFTRFASQPDSVARILRRFRYDELESFFQDFSAKVGEPAELYRGEVGEWAHWGTTSLWAATELVAGATYPPHIVRS